MGRLITSRALKLDPSITFMNHRTGKVYDTKWIKENRTQFLQDATDEMDNRFFTAIHECKSPTLMFFGRTVKKTRITNAPASVVWEPLGVWLLLDACFVLSATDEEFEWVLSHEILHITSDHFSRIQTMTDQIGISLKDFYRTYAMYADLPINELLIGFGMGNHIDISSILTYDTTGIPRSCATFETIVDYIRSNKIDTNNDNIVFYSSGQSESDNNQKDGESDQQSDGNGGTQIMGESEDGEQMDTPSCPGDYGNDNESDQEDTGSNDDKDGDMESNNPDSESDDTSFKTDDDDPFFNIAGDGCIPVSIPPEYVSADVSETLCGIVKDVLERVESSGNDAGFLSAAVIQSMKQMEEAIVCNELDRLVSDMEMFFRATASKARQRKRSINRLNRHTGMPPGRKRDMSYTLMYYIDESGSMNNDVVRLSFEFVRKSSGMRKSDTVYVCHWDTEPADVIEKIVNPSDIPTLTRRKRGGTVFTDMFNHPLITEKKVDARVIITDGMIFGWPKPSSRETEIWLITNPAGYELWEEQYGRGKAFLIDEIIDKMRDRLRNM